MPEEAIPTLLKRIASAEGEINLLNVFMGVPLSYSARIVEVGEATLRVVSDNYQIVGMFMEKITYIQSKWLPEIVRAEVLELNPEQRAATLANFSFVENGIGNRMEVRIQPKEPLEGAIQPADSWTVRGELADISRDGLAIYLNREFFSPRQYGPGAQMSISLVLPGEYSVTQSKNQPSLGSDPIERFSRQNLRLTPIANSGQKSAQTAQPMSSTRRIRDPKVTVLVEVVNLRPEEAHERYRIGMHILSSDPSGSLINQFIAQRQAEIIREIRSLYELLIKKK